MSEPFDNDAFLEALNDIRLMYGASWKQVADESGVNLHTLHHIVQRKNLPRIDTFASLIAWAGLDANAFICRHGESERTA